MVHECRISDLPFSSPFPCLSYITPTPNPHNSRSSSPPLSPSSYSCTVAVVRTPQASDTLVDTGDGLVGALDLVAAGVAQQLDLLQDLQGVHVLDADGLLAAVDVVPDEHRVLPRPRRHRELDLRVLRRELRELRPDEGAVFGGGRSAFSGSFFFGGGGGGGGGGFVVVPTSIAGFMRSSLKKKKKTYFIPLELPEWSQ